MRSDSDIKHDVEDKLRWDPDIKSDDIGVAVTDGAVMLTGFVRSYRQKRQAETDVMRVAGVVAMANDIEVRLPIISQRPDPEIGRDVVTALKAQLPNSWTAVKAIVQGGWVTLQGQVEWNYQRQRAAHAMEHIEGIRGVINSIEVKPSVATSEIKERTKEALKRSAELDGRDVTIETTNAEVILRGTVRSWAERREAERAA